MPVPLTATGCCQAPSLPTVAVRISPLCNSISIRDSGAAKPLIITCERSVSTVVVSTRTGTGVGVEVDVAVGVAVDVLVGVALGVFVADAVAVGVTVGVSVGAGRITT